MLEKLPQCIRSKSDFRLLALFSRCARAAPPARPANKSPGREGEYPWRVTRNSVRKVSTLRHRDSDSQRCDLFPSGNRRAAARANRQPKPLAIAFAFPSRNTSARAGRNQAVLYRNRREKDCLRNRRPAARAIVRQESAPAWISQHATDLRRRCVLERADHGNPYVIHSVVHARSEEARFHTRGF